MKLTTIIQPLFSKYYSIHEVAQQVKNLPAMQEIQEMRVWSSWVGKIPWRGKWQPTPVVLPQKFYGQRYLAGYKSKGSQRVDTAEQLSTQHIKAESAYFSHWGNLRIWTIKINLNLKKLKKKKNLNWGHKLVACKPHNISNVCVCIYIHTYIYTQSFYNISQFYFSTFTPHSALKTANPRQRRSVSPSI